MTTTIDRETLGRVRFALETAYETEGTRDLGTKEAEGGSGTRGNWRASQWHLAPDADEPIEHDQSPRFPCT
jgi:hypothetical protein